MASISNIPTNSRSMNGIIILSDDDDVAGDYDAKKNQI